MSFIFTLINITFLQMSFKSPGYGFTSKSVIYSAFTILKESDKMPSRFELLFQKEMTNCPRSCFSFCLIFVSRGGVYTPGGAFSKTSFFDQLLKNGVSLSILNDAWIKIPYVFAYYLWPVHLRSFKEQRLLMNNHHKTMFLLVTCFFIFFLYYIVTFQSVF